MVFPLARLDEERVMSSTYPVDDDPLARLEEGQMMHLVEMTLDEPGRYCVGGVSRGWCVDIMMIGSYP